MKVINCEQGGAEWHKARAGCITASMFSTVRKKVGMLDDRQALYVKLRTGGETEKAAAESAGYKAVPRSDIIERALCGEKIGDWSDVAKDYAFRLAIERISGMPLDDGFETWSMRRGRELEPAARMEHEAATGIFVETAGFVTTDDGLFGASADGLFDLTEEEKLGGSEYKCFVAPDKLRPILIDRDIADIRDQALGGLWITCRDVWHVGLYAPFLESVGKQFTLVEVPRDEQVIEAMESDLVEFERYVSELEATLRKQAA